MGFTEDFESAFINEIRDLSDKKLIETLSFFYSPEFSLISFSSFFKDLFKFEKKVESKLVVDIPGLSILKNSNGNYIFNYLEGYDDFESIKISSCGSGKVKIDSSNSSNIVNLEGVFLKLKNEVLTKINSLNEEFSLKNDLSCLAGETETLISIISDSRSFGVANVYDAELNSSSWIKVSSDFDFCKREKLFYSQIQNAPLVNSLFPKLKKYSTDSKIHSVLTLDDASSSFGSQRNISNLFLSFLNSSYNKTNINLNLENRVLFSMALFHDIAPDYISSSEPVTPVFIEKNNLKNFIPLDIIDYRFLDNYDLLVEKYLKLLESDRVPKGIVHNDLTKGNIISNSDLDVVFLDPICCFGDLSLDLGKLPFSPFEIDYRVESYLSARNFISDHFGSKKISCDNSDFVLSSELVSFFNNSKKMAYSYFRGSKDFEFYKSMSEKSLVNLLRNY
jgi:hypothetical protein